MTTFFIIFMLVILGIALLITLAVAVRGRDRKVDDSQYIDSEGDHVYYDRSAIEKKLFRRHNPGVKDVRTLRRLLRRGKDD